MNADAHVIARILHFRDNPKLCPIYEYHTDGPEGYMEWFRWADQMQQTHKQVRCPGCGLYAIWVRREPGEAPPEEDFAEYEDAM